MASEAEANFNWKWILALGKCIFEYMCQIFITERDVPVSRLPAVTFPDTSQPVINPVFFPVVASNQRLPKLQIFFISGRFLMGSAQADNQKMYIKSYNDQILGKKRKHCSPNRASWESRISSALKGLCCLWPNLHKVHDETPGVHKQTNLLDDG